MNDLEDIVGMSHVSIRKHLRKAKIVKGKDGRYDVELVLATIKRHQEESAGGSDDSARSRKTKLECDLLQVKLDQLRGELVPVGEVEDMLREMCDVFKGALELYVQYVATETADPAQVKQAEQIRDRTRSQVVSMVGELISDAEE